MRNLPVFLLAVLILHLPARAATTAPTTAPDTTQPAAPLAVELKVKGDTHRIGQPLNLVFRVVNKSKESQSFVAFSCSWSEHWQLSDKSVELPPIACAKNFPKQYTLAPGEVYEREAAATIAAGTKPGEITLKAGFTPHNSDTTLWSDEIKIKLE
ncbi:MAG TPA: hypothetical protein VIL86_09235 [Tepidisphaeraceae bacterium]|jgi:hypothetical protein